MQYTKKLPGNVESFFIRGDISTLFLKAGRRIEIS